MLVYLRGRGRRERRPGWLKSHNSSYNYLELQMVANLFGFAASLLFENLSSLIMQLLSALNNPSRVGTFTLCNTRCMCKPLTAELHIETFKYVEIHRFIEYTAIMCKFSF